MDDRMANTNVTILVVDDSDIVRAVLAGALEARGYRVVEAGGGEEALRWMATHRCDLVLTDVCMPGMDGLELLRTMRAHDGLASVPVMLLSSDDPKVEGVPYLPKEAPDDETITRIDLALKR
jgi:CheY-like chemotaxis protein